MSTPWAGWDHVVKVDPDKDLPPGETFGDVCQTGTDAIMIGGTTGVTAENMQDALAACARYEVPLYIEPNSPRNVIHDERLTGYLVPSVLNAGDVAWIIGFHKEWLRLDESIDWSGTFTEGYIVLNPDSSVAMVTEADCEQRPEDVAAYAAVADRLFGLPIVYVEYSGMLGNPEHVAAAAGAIDDASLFYGGGIHDFDSARTMAEHADVIVVGNLVHDKGAEAVRETVRGAQAG